MDEAAYFLGVLFLSWSSLVRRWKVSVTAGMEQNLNINLGFSAGLSGILCRPISAKFKKVLSALVSIKRTHFNPDLQGHKLVAKLPFLYLKRKNKSCVSFSYLVLAALTCNNQFLPAFASGNNKIASPDPRPTVCFSSGFAKAKPLDTE